ncbi:MAG TPA: PRTRC system ThiF family protein [Terriglobales bacterium]|nr:PRTRC system ThiF family protein [Terriglobales bacterium]
METHQIHPGLLKHKVRVLVVGCGGNGSAIAAGLPYLHQALLAYGHPEGIHVTLLDPDVISATNCVRQPFSQSEIGLYKSVVLANRLNLFWGLDWQGIPERLDPKRRLDGVDIVIGCVDTRKARAAIAKCAEDWSEVDYWLDLGNNADSGQFVLGEPLNRRNRRRRLRLRTVSELFPEVIQGELDGDGLPSCSAAEALDRQEPFVNPTLAHHALALLARLFRYGTISYHGAFVGLSSLPGAQALRIDPKCWRRLRKAARDRQKQEYASHSRRPSAGASGLLAEERKNLQRSLQQH